MGMRVLVLGGTSYVAQFLLQHALDASGGSCAQESAPPALTMACTMRGDCDSMRESLPPSFRTVSQSTLACSSSAITDAPSQHSRVKVYWNVDLATMTGVRECIRHFRPDVVINCIAMSSPVACEKEPERTRAINEPHALIEFLDRDVDWDVRFIHFSTDFAYDGAAPPPSGYCEDAAGGARLTVYGASKLRFDNALVQHCGSLHGFVLRIANVLGPSAPLLGATQPPKFMAWLHKQLFHDTTAAEIQSDRRALRLWSDEVRSFIYVRDLVAIVLALLEANSSASEASSRRFTLLNVGGRDALSRVALAEKYCEASQRSTVHSIRLRAAIEPTARASVDLGYHAPLDARLDTTRLRRVLPSLVLTPTESVLDAIYAELAQSESSRQ